MMRQRPTAGTSSPSRRGVNRQSSRSQWEQQQEPEEEGRFVGTTSATTITEEKWSDERITVTATASYQQQQQQQQPSSDLLAFSKNSGLLLPPQSGHLPLHASATTTKTSAFPQSAPPSLQDFHVQYRNALHVPDKSYGDYLRHGQLYQERRKRGRGLLGKVTKPCCAQVGLGFSLVAVLFLLFCGVLLDTQPLFIKGALPQHIYVPSGDDDHFQEAAASRSRRTSTKVLYKLPGDGQRLPPATAAYKAAAAYLACALYCLHVLHPTLLRNPWRFFRSRRYQTLDNGGHQHDDDLVVNVGTTELPLYSSNSSSIGFGASATYLRSCWNKVNLLMRQWLAARGWYQSGKRRPKRQRGKGKGRKQRRKQRQQQQPPDEDDDGKKTG